MSRPPARSPCWSRARPRMPRCSSLMNIGSSTSASRFCASVSARSSPVITAIAVRTRPGSRFIEASTTWNPTVSISSISAWARVYAPSIVLAMMSGLIAWSSPHGSPSSRSTEIADSDRSSASVSRPCQTPMFARSTRIIATAQRLPSSPASCSICSARARASSMRPCTKRTQASRPSAHATPPQSPISPKRAAEVSSRDSAAG